MLAGLGRNAQKAGADSIVLHQCTTDSLNIGQWDCAIDFVLIMMMLHEVPDPDRLMREVYSAVAPGGKMLFSEPVGHVNKAKFETSVAMIQETGFILAASPKIHFCRSAVFQKERA
jgi:2-polyprenyl-3-methyl-5-hydroxy-6-metoxy-1,4-benzoquinol methylase